MDYYQLLGGLATIVLTVLFGVMSLAPLVTRPDHEHDARVGLVRQSR
jgi:hypothetical protein